MGGETSTEMNADTTTEMDADTLICKDEMDTGHFSEFLNKLASKAKFRKKSTSPDPISTVKSTFYEGDDYDMNYSKRGLALILNNIDFLDGGSLTKRNGAEKDIINLKNTLAKLQFEIAIFENCNQDTMLKIMDSIAEHNHSESDCFLCIIMSHGGNDGINRGVYSADNEPIMLADFVGPIKRCISLIGKPKIFILQACGGHRQDAGNIVADSSNYDNQNDYKVFKYPKEADVLWIHASAFDYTAYRHIDNGSYFIVALCRALEKYGMYKNFLHTLTYANHILTTDLRSDKKYIQTCNYSCSLTRNLYFKPK